MNRVRYGKVNSDGVKTSTSTLVTGDGKELLVNVNVNDNTFNIVSSPEGFVETTGSAKSYQLVLRKVKLALAELGVGLTTESRNRSTGGSGGLSGGQAVSAKAAATFF
jgi:hypothetical protein